MAGTSSPPLTNSERSAFPTFRDTQLTLVESKATRWLSPTVVEHDVAAEPWHSRDALNDWAPLLGLRRTIERSRASWRFDARPRWSERRAFDTSLGTYRRSLSRLLACGERALVPPTPDRPARSPSARSQGASPTSDWIDRRRSMILAPTRVDSAQRLQRILSDFVVRVDVKLWREIAARDLQNHISTGVQRRVLGLLERANDREQVFRVYRLAVFIDDRASSADGRAWLLSMPPSDVFVCQHVSRRTSTHATYVHRRFESHNRTQEPSALAELYPHGSDCPAAARRASLGIPDDRDRTTAGLPAGVPRMGRQRRHGRREANGDGASRTTRRTSSPYAREAGRNSTRQLAGDEGHPLWDRSHVRDDARSRGRERPRTGGCRSHDAPSRFRSIPVSRE